MNAKDAIAIEIYRPSRFRLTVDEWVSVFAAVFLGAALIFGATHPAPEAASCYRQSPSRE